MRNASRSVARMVTTWAAVVPGLFVVAVICSVLAAQEKPAAPAGQAQERPQPLDAPAPRGEPAAPAAAGAPTTQPAATPAEIDALIAQLDDDQFARRQEASKRLEAVGKAAIPALAKSACSPKPEVSVRSMELLRLHLDAENEACRQAARDALTTIAAGEGPAAADARKLLDARKPQPAHGMGRLIIGGNVVIGPGAAVAARKMSVKNVNGVKDIEVEENGRKIKIHDDPANGITVEIPEAKDGKETVKKYEAKTAAELEKKAPEAYKLYKEYSGQGGAVQVQMIGNVGAGAVINVQSGAIAIAPARPNMAQLRLQSVLRQLENLVNDPQVQALTPAVRDEIIKQMEKVRGQLADLEKKLKDEAAKEAKDKGQKPKDEAKPKEEEAKPVGAAGAAVQVLGDGAGEVKVEIKIEAAPEQPAPPPGPNK